MSEYDCIIIGAGVGGLTAGAYLAKSGRKILVVEKNNSVGGMAGTFHLDGYTFDAGGTPQYDQLEMLRELGVDHRISFIPMSDPAIAMYFPGFTLYGPKPIDEFTAQLRDLCTPEELNQCKKILQTFEQLNMDKYAKLNQAMNESTLKFLGGLIRSNPFELVKVFSLMTKNLESWLAKRSDNRHIREVISFINGLTLMYPCERMPALLGVLIMSGFTGKLLGRWHLIKGGNENYSIALAHAVEQWGGTVETGRAVKKILFENGRACGVECEDGKKIKATRIISDIGIKETINHLVGTERFDKKYLDKISALRPSPSLFKICLGLQSKPQLPAVVNFKVCRLNEKKWWEDLESGRLPEKPPVMFWCKYLADPDMAPPDRYDIDILVPAPYRHRDGDWDEVKEREKDAVLSVMEEVIPGIRRQIAFEWLFTPKDLEKYSGQVGGGILPVEPSVDQMMKFPDMNLPVENLYCVGATVKGGAGINGAAYTGKLCADRIDRGEY